MYTKRIGCVIVYLHRLLWDLEVSLKVQSPSVLSKRVCVRSCEDALNEENQIISVGILLIPESCICMSCSHRQPVVSSGANTQANTYWFSFHFVSRLNLQFLPQSGRKEENQIA